MDTRICTKCFEEHPLTFFNKDRSRADGVYPQCKECTRKNCRRVYRKYHDRHVEMKRVWKDGNRERHRQINRQWRQDNPEATRRGTANYRARLKRATPPGTDLEMIELIRSECPPGWHVDHIHALAGANFCGLNVPWNLQYLPAETHWKKGTKLPVVQEAWYNL